MRWIVGVDLREHSHGAVRVAAWLARSSRAHVAIATHVLEDVQDVGGATQRPLTAIETRAMAQLRAALEHDGVDDAFADLGLIEASAAEEGLEAALGRHGAGGLIVGRRAGRYDDAWIRLGGVVRRLLRTLPGPVMVVPPDLPGDIIGEGAVLVAIDLTDASVSALQHARTWAHDVGRPLAAVHVVQSPVSRPLYIPAEDWDDTSPDARPDDGRAAVVAWLRDHQAGDVPAIVLPGHVLHVLRAVIDDRSPSLVVCGSRRLSGAERIFSSSVASHLAAITTAPVVVVPP